MLRESVRWPSVELATKVRLISLVRPFVSVAETTQRHFPSVSFRVRLFTTVPGRRVATELHATCPSETRRSLSATCERRTTFA